MTSLGRRLHVLQLDIIIITRQPTLHQSHHAVGDKPRSTFYVNGVQVCLNTYLYFHFFSRKRYQNLVQHYQQN